MLKIRGSVIFKECATKSSVFNYSKSERNICFLATICRNSRYERPRIHLHTGPQVRHARIAVHCFKSVKTGNCLRAVQETKVHKTDEIKYHRRSYVPAWVRITTENELKTKWGVSETYVKQLGEIFQDQFSYLLYCKFKDTCPMLKVCTYRLFRSISTLFSRIIFRRAGVFFLVLPRFLELRWSMWP